MKRYALLPLFSLVLVACGDDDEANTTPPEVDMGSPEVDMGTDEPDARMEVDLTPPAPIPRFITLDFDPTRPVYKTTAALLPQVEVFDTDGEPYAEALWEITVQPEAAATKNDVGRWVLQSEGEVVFTACTVAQGFEGEDVCATKRVLVDNAPPTITLTSPTAGAQLDATNHPVLYVEGIVQDTHGEPAVWVNGESVEVDDSGGFMAEVAPRFGINHVQVEANDGINSVTSVAGVDVLWAPDYQAPPAGMAPMVTDDEAIILYLGQNFVDDGRPPSTGPDGSWQTHDLADILELVVNNIDFLSQIPNPVVNSSGFTLSITDVDVGKPRVEADITDTGMELYIRIEDMLVYTEGGLAIEGQSLDLNGNISVTASALASIDISKSGLNAPVEVEVRDLALAIEGASANFGSAEANAIFTLAESALRTTLENLLLDTVRDAFVDQIPLLLQDLFDGLDSALRDQTLDLDIGLGTPVSLSLDAGIGEISSRYRHDLSAVLSATASVDSMRAYTSSRGVPLLHPDPAGTPFFSSSRVQLGLRTALANGLLHTLWDAGLLNLDVKEQLPITAQEATLSAKIQPLIRPPLEGQDNDFVIQLGQMELTLQLAGRHEVHGINIETGINFDFANDALSVSFDADPKITTWLVSAEGTPLLSREALESLLRSQVYPQLLSALAGGLSIPLPIPDLSGLGSVAGPLANLQLDLELVAPAEVRDGYIVLDAEIVGTLPRF